MSEENFHVNEMQETQEVQKVQEQKTKPEPVFTQEDLNRVGTKESRKTKETLYAKLGIKDDVELETVLSDLAALRQSKEQSELEKPEIERLRGENEKLKEETYKERKARIELEAKVTMTERKTFLQGNGFEGRELSGAMVEINELLHSDENLTEADWMTVAEKYITENPAPPPPAMATGTGSGKTESTAEADILRTDFEKARQLRNTAEMSRITRLAKQKKIQL